MFLYKKKKISKLEQVNKGALNHWIIQKISALFLLPLVFWFLYTLKEFINKDYSSKITWLEKFPNGILLALFIVAALFHLRLGLTTVIEDYIHNSKTKNFLLSGIAILCLFLAVFTVIITLVLLIKK